MKLHNQIFALGISFFLTTTAMAQVQWADRIAAVVNHDVITEHDVSDMINNIKNGIPEDQLTDTQALRQEALRQLVDQKLLLQLGKKNGVVASQQQIDAVIANVAKSRDMTVPQVYAEIEKEGASRSVFRQTVADNIIVSQVAQQERTNLSHVSDAEVKAFLDSQVTPKDVKEYKLQQIFVKTDGKDLNDQVAKKNLEMVRQLILSGKATFADMAKRYSYDNASADKGGDLGWVIAGTSQPEVEVVLQHMRVGEISQPIKSRFGWRILRLNDERTVALSQEDRVAAARQFLLNKKEAEGYQLWLKKLHDQAYIRYYDQPYK